MTLRRCCSLLACPCSRGFPGWTALQHHRQALQLGHRLLGGRGHLRRQHRGFLPPAEHPHQDGPRSQEGRLRRRRAARARSVRCDWPRSEFTCCCSLDKTPLVSHLLARAQGHAVPATDHFFPGDVIIQLVYTAMISLSFLLLLPQRRRSSAAGASPPALSGAPGALAGSCPRCPSGPRSPLVPFILPGRRPCSRPGLPGTLAEQRVLVTRTTSLWPRGSSERSAAPGSPRGSCWEQGRLF